MNREYISRDSKAPNPLTRTIGLIAGMILVVYGVLRFSWYSAIIGGMLLLALVMVKKIAMNEVGLVTSYNILGIKREEIWAYEDIQEIHKEVSPDGKEMALHVMKDIMSKRLIYPIESYQKVIDLALEKNPKIHVAYIDK